MTISKIKILVFYFMPLFLMVSSSNLYVSKDGHSYIPPNGFVPDKKTALNVAESILLPIYGKESVENQKPLRAELNQNGVWIIKGSLPRLKEGQVFIGGLMYIEIRKSDCKVLRVTHGK